MLSGCVLLDIRDLKPQAARRRMAVLATIPNGARLVLVVGPLAPLPEITPLLREHVDRLGVDVWGEPYAVERWIHALRHGDVMELPW
ncbi:MAG: hypothetical protein ACR2KG_08690 [Nocardioidaceae bacterium]